ncbi:PIN domain-containing protein [uncultured Gimesia sp.]|uniref:PIN/TRAM domain-containing protein n=1 Tax=uncultured Gimesia sp. TaxID=1678688 RepID=UPI0030DD27F7|tara:strand:+ start:8353 stop:9372 length:1020 start_codon:yes stop_codon:yes gene_type:complete
MLLISIRVLYAFVCAGAIATYVSSNPPSPVDQYPLISFVLLMIFTQGVTCMDLLISRKRIEVMSAIYFGLLVGVLLSYLLIQALTPVISKTPWGEGVVMITTLTLPYLCISFLLQTKDDFRFIVPYVEFARELKGGRPLVLDSSALIDGRIADVVETKILDSEMVVPDFILKEVQDIADSSDKVRRVRGRRGLDILSTLQNNPIVDISMYDAKESDKEKGLTVDQRLVVAAKKLGGKVVTNDFNLNKVASVQGVDVINLNDVANSLKPRYLPGEHIQLKIIKEGESQAQGVGYLDDGTMVVCEQANHLVGRDVDAVVTSVLQSSAGRMIFGRVTDSRQL